MPVFVTRSVLLSHLLSLVVLLVLTFSEVGVAQNGQNSDTGKTQIIRVYFPNRDTGNQIFISFEAVIQYTDYTNNFHIMKVTDKQLVRIIEVGLAYETDDSWQPPARLPTSMSALDEAIYGYPCYETVEETYAKAETMTVDYPNLADWLDVGDSWEQSADVGGYDMMVLVLTNKMNTDEKPKLFITCAIHAREYATAPLCLEFARRMLAGYDTDPEATWILDHHEIHIMLHANPDGRKQAELGMMWRKNTDLDYCIDDSNNRGADLNRNFDYNWGCCDGSSTEECYPTFRGLSAASEPETQAIQDYMLSVFPDQRGSGPDAAAPDDATGVFIDVHSFSELILWPWGTTPQPAPNGIQMQTLGRRMAFWNGYTPQQGYALYATDGTTTAFTYGELGVPSYTFEIGTTFFQDCTSYYETIVPDNLPALTYAAKVARTPYITPSGPNVTDPKLDSNYVMPGDPLLLSVIVDDTQFNNINGTEPSQNVQAVEYYIDIPPWTTDPVPTANPMSPSDSAFDSPFEKAEAIIDTTGLSIGRHIVFIRGQDVDGVWGAVSSTFIYLGVFSCTDDNDCDDGLFCNGSEVCLPGGQVCRAGVDPCPDRPCNDYRDICGCVDDSECDDGVYCNGVESCINGSCRSGSLIICNDNVYCTYDSCDEASASCQYTPNNALCDDSDECTQDLCSVSQDCQNTLIPNCGNCLSYEDTILTHQAEQRVYGQIEQDCSSCWWGCYFPYGCSAERTRYFAVGSNEDLGTDGGISIALYSQDQGQSWSTTECVQPCTQNEDCSDGNYCNGQEQCANGLCQDGVTVDCDDDIACTIDSCGESTQSCQNLPDDSACDDADPCTLDVCSAGFGCSNQPISDCTSCLDDGEYCSTDDECCSLNCSGFWIFKRCS